MSSRILSHTPGCYEEGKGARSARGDIIFTVDFFVF